MSDFEFSTPVVVRSRSRHIEVDGVNEALTFLMHWPATHRAEAFQAAVAQCEAALDGEVTVAEAREAFDDFAAITCVADWKRPRMHSSRLAAHPNLLS